MACRVAGIARMRTAAEGGAKDGRAGAETIARVLLTDPRALGVFSGERGNGATGDGPTGDAVFAADESATPSVPLSTAGRQNVAVALPPAAGGAVRLGAEAPPVAAWAATDDGGAGAVRRVAAGAGADVVADGAGGLAGGTAAVDGVPGAAGVAPVVPALAVDVEGAGPCNLEGPGAAEAAAPSTADVHAHGVGVGRSAAAAVGHHAGVAHHGCHAPGPTHAHPAAVRAAGVEVVAVLGRTTGAEAKDAGR